ncbi:alpha-2-macroglobulin-like protein 1 [Phoenicopterus ruber ruber]
MGTTGQKEAFPGRWKLEERKKTQYGGLWDHLAFTGPPSMGAAAAPSCLLLCILYLTAGASAKPHYMVLFPSVLYYPYTGKVHVHLADLDEPVRVTLHLASSHHVPNITLEKQDSDVLQLNWPRFSNISTPPAEIYEVAHLHVSIQGGSLQVSEQKKVLVKSLELGTLVQTDKDVYEPGQTVKFRIFHLDQNFIPSNRELPLVVVKDPSGNRVAEWREVTPRQGIVDLSFPLAAEPALGTYLIEVKEKRQTFSVKDHGLPRFEVLIRLPHVVTVKDEKIPLDVCGRYPSGKTFRGRAEARLCQSHKYIIFQGGSRRICAEFRGQTGRNGCFSTEVLVASLNLTSLDYESQLYAYASLLEEGTGMWRAKTESLMIVYERAMITFENTDKFYKPGIPYTGTMLLEGADGAVLPQKQLLLVVSQQGKDTRQTFLTDRAGRASFKLETSGWSGTVSLSGEVNETAHTQNDGSTLISQKAYEYLSPFFSASGSFLQMRRLEIKLPCGRPQQLWVDYIFSKEALGTQLDSLDVVFLVLAKGTIATVLRKELPVEAGTSGLRGSFSLELPIGPELAPTAKVLGYVVLPDGEMVADSTELKVAKCFPNKVNLSFPEPRALVGSRLRLKVQAAPGSLCAIYAVDQRARSSGPKGTLSPSMVFNLLPTFSEDGYPSEIEELHLPHCWINGFINGLALLPATNCFDVPRHSWRNCRRLGRRAVPVSDARPGFYSLVKDAGLKTVTNAQLGCALDIQHQRPLYLQGEWRESDEEAGVMQDTGMQMDFLETWLWELVPVGEGGSAEMTVTVPDAITEWEAGMFCTSPLGLGLAPATTLTAFKPFFVELALPYAVVRHEAFTLVATVFNYLRQCLRVRVMLVESAELEVLAGTDEGAYRGCVCADEERTFQWSLRATSLAEVNVTVIAKALHSKQLCGTKMPVVPAQGRVDTETKLLAVQPPKPM